MQNRLPGGGDLAIVPSVDSQANSTSTQSMVPDDPVMDSPASFQPFQTRSRQSAKNEVDSFVHGLGFPASAPSSVCVLEPAVPVVSRHVSGEAYTHGSSVHALDSFRVQFSGSCF
jgi:hypothetical protein